MELTMTAREWALAGDRLLAEHGPGLAVTLTEPVYTPTLRFLRVDWFGFGGYDEAATVAVYTGRPFASWHDACDAICRLREQTTDKGEPVCHSSAEEDLHLASLRWPGVTIRLAEQKNPAERPG